MRLRITHWLLRGLLTVILGVAGVAKLLDPAGFATQIANYELVPSVIGRALAVYLPWLELILAATVWYRRAIPASLILIAGLGGVFIAAKATLWWRDIDVDCGCFGSWLPLGQTGSFLIAAVILLTPFLVGWVGIQICSASLQTSNHPANVRV